MSADYDLRSDITMPVNGVLATLSATTAGAAVDNSGFNGVTHGWYVGIGGITFSGTNRIDIVAEESDDGSTWVAITDSEALIFPYGMSLGASGIITSYIAAKAAADTSYNLVGYRGKKQYSRLKALFGGTHGSGTPIEFIAIKSHPISKPVWQTSIEV